MPDGGATVTELGETSQSFQWLPTQCLTPGKPAGKVRLPFCHVALLMFKTKNKGYRKGTGFCFWVDTEGKELEPGAQRELPVQGRNRLRSGH